MTQLFPQLSADTGARAAVITGDRLTAQRAAEIGLANHVRPDTDVGRRPQTLLD